MGSAFWLAMAVWFCWVLSGCGSAPRSGDADSNAPPWIHQAARTVDNGYIVYVESGRDRSSERARLLAEGEALTDLAAECSFAPKGARIEDRYEEPTGILYTDYVKVAVDFQTCEQAKAQVQPEDIRRLASVTMAQEIRRYQDVVNDQLDGSEDGPELSPQTQAALAQTGAPAYDTSTGPGVRVAVIQSEPMFWYWREQIAYEKQVVILAPPAQYAPGSPASQQFVSHVTAPASQVQAYESAHPDLRASTATYSAFHEQIRANRMAAMRGGARRFPGGGARGRPRGMRQGGRRRRRW